MEKIKIIGARSYEEVRDLCHEIKQMDAFTIVHTIAQQLYPALPDKCILIPVPGHDGKATYTLKLAKAIVLQATFNDTAEKIVQGIDVLDILRSAPHKSLCEIKHENGDANKVKLHVFQPTFLKRQILDAYIEQGYAPVLVDNVIDTGKTAKACLDALGLDEASILVIGSTRAENQITFES